MRILSVYLVSLAACLPVIARANHAPLPQEILQAKTVCVLNHTKNKSAGNQALKELTKWGRFKVVQKPEDAELVLLLSTRSTKSQVEVAASKDSEGFDTDLVELTSTLNYDYICVFDRKTRRRLWSGYKQLNFYTRNPIGSLVKELRKNIEDQEKPAKG
jgi:hypothetical protein